MKHTTFLLILIIRISCLNAQTLQIRSCSMQINVTDIPKALGFYIDKLGFSVKSIGIDSTDVAIGDFGDEHLLVLHLVKKLNPITNNSVGPCITLQVNNLDSSITRLKRKGVSFKNYVRRKEGVGFAIYCEDPFGTPISLMHETILETPYFEEPRIYNYGLLVTDIDSARNFYKRLGFVERSTRYLPDDMPLGYPDGQFVFMLHHRENIKPLVSKSPDRNHFVILFEVQDIMATVRQLGLHFSNSEIQKDAIGEYVLFEDNSGIVSKIFRPLKETGSK